MKLRSKFERRIAGHLTAESIKWKYEVTSYSYNLKVLHSYCADCGSKEVYNEKWYTPDFFIGDVIIEAKGKFTAVERKKMLAMKLEHPTLDLRLLFMRDNKLHPRSTTRYTDWAKANGYKCAVGEIPQEWIEEFKKNEEK